MPPADVTSLADKLKQQKGITITHKTIEGASHFFDPGMEEMVRDGRGLRPPAADRKQPLTGLGPASPEFAAICAETADMRALARNVMLGETRIMRGSARSERTGADARGVN